jgi:predicted phosphodiesterase
LRIGIIADIHANLPAFEVVLAQLKEQDATGWLWCLGDVVGYGPYPNECLDLLRTYTHVCMPGNHDWGAVGKAERVVFNDAAGFVLDWTTQQLTPANRAYLTELQEVRTFPLARMTLVHASPRDPIWEYVVEPKDARVCFPFFRTRDCLMGHTHLPSVFRQADDDTVTLAEPQDQQQVRLGGDRLMINPGSVGQPRNGDPRAHFAVLDTHESTITFHRIAYPIATTQARMRELHFPERLITRLASGS